MEKRGKKCIPFRAAFAAVSALGCLFHFLYRISGSNPAVGLFTSVSESTWEHMKLLFFPMVLYIIVQWILCGRSSSGYLPAMTKGLLLGLCFIPTAFYTYTGVLGRNHFIADILIFFISVYYIQVFQLTRCHLLLEFLLIQLCHAFSLLISVFPP